MPTPQVFRGRRWKMIEELLEKSEALARGVALLREVVEAV